MSRSDNRRADHQANDRALCAHLLANMSFQAASRQHPADAITFREAARRASEDGTTFVRASVLSRLAYGYAAAGRSAGFERTSGLARELIENRTDIEPEPRWMYFLTPNHLARQSGYALINLGRAEAERGDRARGRRLVRQGQDLLETGAYTVQTGATRANAGRSSRGRGWPSATAHRASWSIGQQMFMTWEAAQHTEHSNAD